METTIDSTKPEFFTTLLRQLTDALCTVGNCEIPAAVHAQINAASDAFSQLAPVIPKLALLAGCEKLDLFINGQETDRRKLAALSMRLRIMAHLDRTFSKSVLPAPRASSTSSPLPPAPQTRPPRESHQPAPRSTSRRAPQSSPPPDLHAPLIPARTLLAAGPPTPIQNLADISVPLHSVPPLHRSSSTDHLSPKQSICSHILARAGKLMADSHAGSLAAAAGLFGDSPPARLASA